MDVHASRSASPTDWGRFYTVGVVIGRSFFIEHGSELARSASYSASAGKRFRSRFWVLCGTQLFLAVWSARDAPNGPLLTEQINSYAAPQYRQSPPSISTLLAGPPVPFTSSTVLSSPADEVSVYLVRRNTKLISWKDFRM